MTTLTQAQMMAKIQELEAALKAKSMPKLTVKRADKTGAVMVLGLQRFPVTLYASQWEILAQYMPTVLEFIKANKATLASKGE